MTRAANVPACHGEGLSQTEAHLQKTLSAHGDIWPDQPDVPARQPPEVPRLDSKDSSLWRPDQSCSSCGF